MGRKAEELGEHRARTAKLIAVRKKSVSGTHLAVLRNVTLCGWILRWQEEGNCWEVDEESGCAACRAVVDVICEEFE